ncbi:MAG: hypothetical protein Q9160_006080 [Pyrenula sp. 1 TL-2023]
MSSYRPSEGRVAASHSYRSYPSHDRNDHDELPHVVPPPATDSTEMTVAGIEDGAGRAIEIHITNASNRRRDEASIETGTVKTTGHLAVAEVAVRNEVDLLNLEHNPPKK